MTGLQTFFIGLLYVLYTNAEQNIAEKINNMQDTWQAQDNHITQRNISDIQNMMGTKLDRTRLLPVKGNKRMLWNIPATFDARSYWPACTTISSVKDQSDCGACWAVAAASCMSDRLCIATSGAVNVNISAEYMLSCCSYCGDGCHGGYPEEAWAFAQSRGVVTGGDYGSNEGCQPYAISPCSNTNKQGLPTCVNEVDTPSCKRGKCTNKNFGQSFSSDIHKFKTPYRVSPYVTAIQAEILENGPVEAGMNVFMDFNYYKSGVYQYTYGKNMGGHAVRIIGWGVENGVNYWLCANSWTRSWGENGFFKILRGSNECGIEDYIIAGVPVV